MLHCKLASLRTSIIIDFQPTIEKTLTNRSPFSRKWDRPKDRMVWGDAIDATEPNIDKPNIDTCVLKNENFGI